MSRPHIRRRRALRLIAGLAALGCAHRVATPIRMSIPTSLPARAHGADAAPVTARAYLPYSAALAGWAPRPSRVWGTHFSMEWDAAEHAQDIALEPPRLAAAGITALRTNMYWRDVEPVNTTPDRFAWAAYDERLAAYSADGRDVVVSVVAYPKWAMVYACGFGFTSPAMADEWRSFMRAAAERYRAAPYHVIAWEIGNEVDGKTTVTDADRLRPPDWGGDEPAHQTGGCWGDRVAEYIDFLRIAHEEVKRADPTAMVTFGNLAYADVEHRFHIDFLDRFLELGGADYIDYVGYHWFPDVRGAFPTEPPGPDLLWRLSGTLKRHGVGRPIWLTETNRGTQVGSAALEARQVEFLTQTLPEVLAQGAIERVYWYAWGDFPGQAADAWQRGLVRADRSAKPALSMVPYARRYTDGYGAVLRYDDVIALGFHVPRAAIRHVIAWTPDGRSRTIDLPLAPGETATRMTFPMALLVAGRCCPTAALPVRDGRVTVPVGAQSVFVEIRSPR
ncbi:MAG: hypothetical protein ABI780_05285 [Ardenticatenales bacterium]